MRILVLLVAAALSGCAYVGGPASPSPEPTATPTATTEPTEAPTSPPTAQPTPGPTPTPENRDAQRRAQAEHDLQQWADFMADKPADTIIFIWQLYNGGGWRGHGAGDRKEAFLSGHIDATVELPANDPAPDEVTWPDHSTQTVDLMSAAEAFEKMVAELRGSGGACVQCPSLEVTGAHLSTAQALTWRGEATVPVWQFEFVARDTPLTPITYVAVKDAISGDDWDAWGRFAPQVDGAYGSPEDTQITIAFGGGACSTGHSITAVESNLAIVPIITATARPGDCVAVRVGYKLVLGLDAPLGNRAVLDLENGWPAPVYAEDPPPGLRPG